MNALERLAQAGTNSVGTHSFIDADTIRNPDGPNFRLQGFDAPEIAGWKGGQWKAGTAGAADATREITGLAESQGYTNLVKLTNPDGTPKMDATGSRQLVELHDAEGRNFTTELLKSGALDAGKYTTQDDIDAINVARAFGNNNEAFNNAAKIVSGAIEDETTRPIDFRQAALSEAQYGAQFDEDYDGPATTAALSFRKTDRDIRNNSRNPMSDAWDMGWIGAKEGYYGFLEMMGETTDVEWAKDIGEQGIARAQAQQQEFGKVLTDWKDVDGIGTGVSFLVNNAAMSMPYMITTAGAAAAGTLAAPVVGTAGAIGVGVGVPSMVYAGQTWNEMEGEKNAGIALTAGLVQGSLDRLGIGAITGKAIKGNITDAAVKKIMKSQGLGKQAAEQMLANATKRELADFLRESGKIATGQLVAKESGKAFLKSAASEGITEVMQEATAYVAATQGSDKEFHWEELNERMIAAAIAGSTLGGAFSVPGSAKGALDHRALLGDHALADHTTAQQSAVWADEEAKTNGYVATNAENLATIRQQIKDQGIGTTLDERAAIHNTKKKSRSLEEKVSDAFNSIPALWRGATRNIFTDDIMTRSRSARMAADLFGGNPDRVFSGAAFEDAKHLKVAEYKNMITIPEQVYNTFNEGKKFNQADKDRISGQIYGQLRNAIDNKGKFNPDLITDGKHKQTLVKLGNELNALSDKMYADQKKHNPELGYIGNYLFKYKTMNKNAVHNNRKKFEQLLKKNYNMSDADAKETTSRIVDDPNIGDIDEAFSVVKGGIVPSSHKKRSLGLSENKDFQEFLENDIFANVSHAAKSAARYSMHREFIGKNGEVVSKLLDNIQSELGNTPEAQAVVEKMAAQMKDYLDAESGNYKRPTTKFGKQAQGIQKNAMMLMTFSGLPLAFFSSIVERALTTRGLRPGQISGNDTLSLKSQGKDFARGITKYIQNVGDAATKKDRYREDTEGQAKVRDLGFYEWDVGAATVTGVTEVNARQQKWFDAFFKANGLTQWTDYTRMLRASIAGDFMSDNVAQIMDHRRSGKPLTKDIQERELQLRNLGLNLDRFMPLQEKVGAGMPLNAQEQAEYDAAVREATFAFVNEAVVLPNSANRPLLYQDPRFALFTQFQGFLSTFTSKVLPKLYRDAFGGSTPTMQYKAWATMATMIMLGFASQHIKDFLKYGEDEEEYERKTGLNPYLDTPEYIRRGLMSTGLLGTGERVINAMFPIYETRSDGPGDWVFNQAVGESPALGWAARVANATGNLASGDVGRATEQTLKAAPIFGPFSLANKKIGEVAAGWNFKGDSE